MAKRARIQKSPAPVETRARLVRTPRAAGKSAWLPVLLRAALIVAAGLFIYWPALQGGWLWDDHLLIDGNPLVRDPHGLSLIWNDPGRLIDFQPITASVLWLGWHLWGDEPLAFHLLSLALHLTGALLVWRLLAKFHLRWAWIGWLIFAVHPVQVESVAWMSELKNTLSLPPFLLAACCYLDFDARRRWLDYLAAFALFVVAMLCKPAMVMFPFVILAHAWWRRRRIALGDVAAAAPFLAISFVLGFITLVYMHDAIRVLALPLGGLFARAGLAGFALAFYLTKCVLPIDLMPIYPRWPAEPTLLALLPWLAFAGAFVWLETRRGNWARDVIFGLCFFALNLLPFAGFLPATFMKDSWVADRLLYLPIVGLIPLAVAGIERLCALIPDGTRPMFLGGATVLPLLLALESRAEANHYRDEMTFWNHAIASNPGAWSAHTSLGNALLDQGRIADALEQYLEAAQLKPDDRDALVNLAIALEKLNRVDDAIAVLRLAVRAHPDDAAAHSNLGNLLAQTGHLDDASAEFQRALDLEPGFALAENNWGNALIAAGRTNDALVHFERAVKIDPGATTARYNYGVTLYHLGRLQEAEQQFAITLQIDPDFTPAKENLRRLREMEDAAQKAGK